MVLAPCAPGPCRNGGACKESEDYESFSCICPTGWQGEAPCPQARPGDEPTASRATCGGFWKQKRALPTLNFYHLLGPSSGSQVREPFLPGGSPEDGPGAQEAHRREAGAEPRRPVPQGRPARWTLTSV